MEHITVREILEATGGRLLCGEESVPLKHISIDSRAMQGDDLFVPLVGEKVDAHKFIGQALEHGAAAVLTSEHDQMESEAAWIRVDDTKKALQAVGSYYRRRLPLPLVGVTGSVGKTTTREMIAAALSARYKVYKTPGNHNSQIGVPVTLSEISSSDEIGVIELGMSEPGELTVIAQLAQINMAVITNVGITHIEQLGSRDNIYQEKISIQDGLVEGGVLFLNGDDDMLAATKARDGFRRVTFGTGEHCDYRAVDVELFEGHPEFTAVHGEERAAVRLKVMGRHNVQNAMSALAVAGECGIPMAEAADMLAEFTGFKNRQQIYHHQGLTVIDDTYNASPVSMKASLDILRSLTTDGKRIAVLADMKELGPEAPKYHYEIGSYIAGHPVDEVILLGELAREIKKGIEDQTDRIMVREFGTMEELTEYLKAMLTEGDCVLFKGSNSMKLGDAAVCFLPSHSSDR